MYRSAKKISQTACAEFLHRSLPLADRISITEGLLERIAEHCLKVRREMPWGAQIPESVFQSFVLFPRVNNEDPIFYHEFLYEKLKPRIEGLSMECAVREINFCCFEWAGYQSTDDRTANPLTTIRRGFGRCGEESVLLVSALRACGIPARQVYVPRWSHCDDNHAWVEVWIDGKWHYLGACEPEPVLDSGWFTAAASKAMLVHTPCCGTVPEGEHIASRQGDRWILNRTFHYAPVRRIQVIVTEQNRPKQGVSVRFELLNMAEFYAIHEDITDDSGSVSLETGFGSIHLHVTDGRRFLCKMAAPDDSEPIVLRFDEAVEFDPHPSTLRQLPPVESKIQPSIFQDRNTQVFHQRMCKAQAERLQNRACSADSDEVYNVGQNEPVIRCFLNGADHPLERAALLNSLRAKDRVDATAEMLEDALIPALSSMNRYPRKVWEESVLCPRVDNEMLYADRNWFKVHLGPFSSAMDVWKMLNERLKICEMLPETLFPRLRCAMESACADERVRDVLFVAICRAHGIAARLNPASKVKEVWENGAYTALIDDEKADASQILVNDSPRPLQYGVDFSIGCLEHGVWHTLNLQGKSLETRMEMSVRSGCYRIIVCTRQIDGSLDASILPVIIEAGQTAQVTLSQPAERMEELIHHTELPPLQVEWHGEHIFLPECGKPSIFACIAPGEEPSEHFLNELLAAKEFLAARRIGINLILNDPESESNEKLQQILKEVKRVCILTHPDAETLLNWRRLLNAGDLRLPFAAAIDRSCKGLFAFANYNVGTVMNLIHIIESEERNRTWINENGFMKPNME